jgi:phage pi2 protein 07
MAKISTYPTSLPTVNDILIGSEADNLDVTKNFLLSDIIALIPGGSLSVQSLNGLTGVVTTTGTGGIVIGKSGNNITIDGSLAGNLQSLTTTGTSGAATLAAGVLNIPVYAGGGGVTDVNSITGSVSVQSKGGIAITEVGNVLFVDGTNAGQFDSLTTTGSTGLATLTGGVLNIPDYSGVTDINAVTGAITMSGKGGLIVTEVGSIINFDAANVTGNVSQLTTTGNSGAATLVSKVLNIPQYQRALTVTTGGTGAASLVGAQLNIPYESLGLTTAGNSGVATLINNVLNVPAYQRALTVTTGGTGGAALFGANLSIPYENPYNTGTPVNVAASAGGSSTITAAPAGAAATVNVYDATWSGGNGTYTLTLPSAVTDAYRKIRIITDGTFTVNSFRIEVTAPSLQTINGAAFVEVNTSYSGILVWSDGANWRVIQAIS